MKIRRSVWLAALLASQVQAQGQITVPWEEFQRLYRQQLVEELQPAVAPTLSVVQQLETLLALSNERVVARISLSGEVRGESPEPLALFDAALAVLSVEESSGGVLMAGEEGFFFHADGPGPFSLSLTAALPVQRDRRSAYLHASMPPAVRHELRVASSDEWRILEAPGIPSGEDRYALRPDEPLQLRFARVEATAEALPQDLPEVASAALVLEQVDFSTAYSDNGNAFSTLRLSLPEGLGRQLRFPAITDSEVWTVQVDGAATRLLRQGEDWIIPLPGDAREILLSYLRSGERLGLEGRLELPIPALGLPAREARVTVGLPGRVALMALEGDLEPAASGQWQPPPGFSGESYRFRYPYYRGEALTAAIYYQEPVTEEQP